MVCLSLFHIALFIIVKNKTNTTDVIKGPICINLNLLLYEQDGCCLPTLLLSDNSKQFTFFHSFFLSLFTKSFPLSSEKPGKWLLYWFLSTAMVCVFFCVLLEMKHTQNIFGLLIFKPAWKLWITDKKIKKSAPLNPKQFSRKWKKFHRYCYSATWWYCTVFSFVGEGVEMRAFIFNLVVVTKMKRMIYLYC